jgi:hypothetical protein
MHKIRHRLRRGTRGTIETSKSKTGWKFGIIDGQPERFQARGVRMRRKTRTSKLISNINCNSTPRAGTIRTKDGIAL